MSLGKEEKTHENPLPELFLKRKKVDHAAVDNEQKSIQQAAEGVQWSGIEAH